MRGESFAKPAKGWRPSRQTLVRPAACLVLLVLAMAAGAPPARAESPTLLRWLGHGFFVVASRKSIKIAVDPFDPAQLAYQLPEKITANILLVTHESDLANATSNVSGAPEIFRSTTAVGVNRGAGITFNGVRTFRDPTRSPLAGRNVIFVFEVDGLRFAFVGALGHRLDGSERQAVGRADVVVGAFGPPLGPDGLLAVAADLDAKIVIPAAYRTPVAGAQRFPEIEALTAHTPRVRKFDVSTVDLSPAALPAETEIWVLASPTPELRKREGIEFPGMAEHASE